MDSTKKGDKVLQYETFLNERLRTDLNNVLIQREKIYLQIADYLQLRNTVDGLQSADAVENDLKMKVDIGCNFYVQAVVPNAKRIFVNLGFGFYAELTLDEALDFVSKKVTFLEDIAKKQSAEALKIKTHIRMVIEGLRELQFVEESK